MTDKAITLNWSQVAEGNGYQIQYSQDQGFGSGVTRLTVAGANTLSRNITGLNRNTRYYFKLQATADPAGDYLDSALTGAKAQKTQKTRLLDPAINTVTATSNSATVSWGQVPHANGYWIYYGLSNGFDTSTAGVLSKRISGGASGSASIDGLSPNTMYYFKMVASASASSAYQDSVLGSAKTQTTQTPTPARPRIIQPLATPIITSRRQIWPGVGYPKYIDVRWNRVPNASGYTLRYKMGNGRWRVDTINSSKSSDIIFYTSPIGTSVELELTAKGTGNYRDSGVAYYKFTITK